MGEWFAKNIINGVDAFGNPIDYKTNVDIINKRFKTNAEAIIKEMDNYLIAHDYGQLIKK